VSAQAQPHYIVLYSTPYGQHIRWYGDREQAWASARAFRKLPGACSDPHEVVGGMIPEDWRDRKHDVPEDFNLQLKGPLDA